MSRIGRTKMSEEIDRERARLDEEKERLFEKLIKMEEKLGV
jgi:hypothetical protein